jgi:hypothetical protein
LTVPSVCHEEPRLLDLALADFAGRMGEIGREVTCVYALVVRRREDGSYACRLHDYCACEEGMPEGSDRIAALSVLRCLDAQFGLSALLAALTAQGGF